MREDKERVVRDAVSQHIYLLIYLDYEKVLSENMSTLTRILLNRTFSRSNGPESNERGRKEGKEEGEKKKLSILMSLYRRL